MGRILTTHVGSLPRPADVTAFLFRQNADEPLDRAAFAAALEAGVDEAVRRQVAAGIDIVSDGEMSKISYATYIKDRFSGFEGDSPRKPPRDLEDFPGYLERIARSGGTPTYRRPRCTGPIRLKDPAPLAEDIARLERAMARHGAAMGFMNAPAPGIVALFQPSDHHADPDAYLVELGEALRYEYETIVAAGLILQIDAPDLALGRHTLYKDVSEAGFLARIGRHVAILNEALRNVPADRVRLHVCWGNYDGPHHHDIPLERIVATVLEAKPRTLLFEAANPRHAHEWTVWRDRPIPDGYVLVPGCLDSTTNYIEHPELVAQRIATFAAIVGPERVIAGTDCGFGTFAGFGAVDPDIAWAKLAALGEGAGIASRRLAAGAA
jgi:5-methyltetrahydropteroyltriglutamate--homocysteine methyltransferase